ncbi:MAG TPA: hypothetical protein VM408_00310 [Methylomirabilota bacterium]|nr:hypothetical protein [Methylomirabilota bacterium]
MTRRLTALVAACALLLALAVPVLAGGWADIKADAQTTTTPPVEGQPIDLGFVVLQHGVTPAGWEKATVHLTNAATGTTLDVAAVNDGADGHFTATAVLPEPGDWSWNVTLQDLQSSHQPVALHVAAAPAAAPGPGQTSAIGGIPLLAALSVAVLIGFAAGSAMTLLVGRRRPGVKVSPAPRGVDPA